MTHTHISRTLYTSSNVVIAAKISTVSYLGFPATQEKEAFLKWGFEHIVRYPSLLNEPRTSHYHPLLFHESQTHQVNILTSGSVFPRTKPRAPLPNFELII
jgi:hypothetical protein